MKKNFYLAIALLGFSVSLNAQTAKKGVGIKTDTPQTTLDVRAEATDASMPDGVLVPRLTVTELNAKSAVYGADQNGALVFVTSNTQGGAGTKVEKVKDPGFYYYDHATSKWKGVGGGDAGQINGPVHVNTNTGGNVRSVPLMSANDWQDNDYIIIATAAGPNLFLPDATLAKNKGRVVSLVNQTGTPKSFVGAAANSPSNNGTLLAGKGSFYVSDGTTWHTIGGF